MSRHKFSLPKLHPSKTNVCDDIIGVSDVFDKSLYFGRFRGVLAENKEAEFNDLCYGEISFFDAQYFGFFKDNDISGLGTLITKKYAANGIFENGKFVRGTIHMFEEDYCIVLEHANEDGTWSGAVYFESGTWMQGLFSKGWRSTGFGW